FVITSSVAIAGVLMVFSFLVIPAVIANLFARRIGARLAIGWSVGIAACLAGLAGSYRLDMPSGPAVVTSLGVTLILAALIFYIRSAPRKTTAVMKTLAGITAVAVLIIGMYLSFGEHGILAIPHEHDWESGSAEAAAAGAPEPADPLERFDLAASLVEADDLHGLEIAFGLLSGSSPPLVRDDAYGLILEATGQEFDYDPFGTDEGNGPALARIEKSLNLRLFRESE
ncbi:MAG: metal ABC transporter permease, partial [Acidobacteria bacterium]|nr:metal ABC transporter permease [Candidatus Polarisedimenticola svalbardensis]